MNPILLSQIEASLHFRPFLWRWGFYPWSPRNCLAVLQVGPFTLKLWRPA
jgi:hypothetical protein